MNLYLAFENEDFVGVTVGSKRDIDAYSRVIELFPETRYTTLITVFFLPLSFLIAQ